MSDDRTALGTNLLLFLVGAAAGAVLVALTTPKSGPDLRTDIKDLAGRLKRRLRETGEGCPVCADEAHDSEATQG
jgi:gas vesicle protein